MIGKETMAAREGGWEGGGFYSMFLYLNLRLVDEARGHRSIWHATCDRPIDCRRSYARFNQRESSCLY